MDKISIAIDGPASAGKSTVAKILAKELGYIYCDTGAMYRALTYAALQAGTDKRDGEALAQLLAQLVIRFEQQPDEQHVYLNDQDVTHVIRENQVTQAVSEVSAHAQVRTDLVKRQQKIA